MKITFCVETGWPEDRRRKRGESELTGLEWIQVREFPMAPRKDDLISLGDDEYRRVEEVFFKTPCAMAFEMPEVGIEVHFAFDEAHCSHATMVAAGWREA